MSHRRWAFVTIAAALATAAVLGAADSLVQPHWPLWHAEFCSLANAVTDGCDVPPARNGYLVTALEYLLVVPLFGATFSLLTSGFTSGAVAVHIRREGKKTRQHVSTVVGGTDATDATALPFGSRVTVRGSC